MRKVIFVGVDRELVGLETNDDDVSEVPSGADWLNKRE
jgi:hypothetical protein